MIMKKILLIFLLFVSGYAISQGPPSGKYTLINQQYNWLAGYFRGLGVPVGCDTSTAFLPTQWRGAGAIYFDSCDAALYIWTGVYWKEQGSGGGGSGSGIGAIYTQYGITKVNDSTVRADTTVGAGLISWPRYLKLKDSISSIYTPMARSISTGYGLTGGGDFSTNRTHLADTAVGAGLIGWPRLEKFRDSIFSVIPAQVNLIAGTNVTITGTYPNKTINAAGDPNWVFLSDYGTPDDGLSDTAAIKAAVATGKNVYVTPGEWLWDGWRCTLNSNQIIRGYGPTSIIRFTKDTANVFWIPQGTHHVQIDYINFIGKGRGAAPGGEVFTESNAIFIQGDSNRVQYCNFKAVKGSGIHAWVAAGTMYANEVSYCRFDSCGVGIYALNNAEYSLFLANQAYYCRWGFYERCAGNNTWDAFTSNYNDVGFGLLGSDGCNGDHGSVSNARINHNTTALDVRQCNNEYLFENVKFYNGAVNIGSLDTAKRVLFSNCVLSGNTFTVTKALSCQFSGGTFGTTAVTIVGSDDDEYFTFCNVQNSPYSGTPCGGSASLTNPMTTAEDIIVGGVSGSPTRLAIGANGTFLGASGGTLQYLSLPGGGDVSKVGTPVNNQIGVWTGDGTIEGDANFTWDGTTHAITGALTASTSVRSPLIIGSTTTTGDLDLRVTSGVGATGAEFRVSGGNNGASNFLTINNAGEWGIGVAATAGFKWFMKSNSAGDGTVYHLWRNSSDHNVFQMSDLGSTRIGNQSLTTSVNNFYNNNMMGGAGTPTARAHLIAGTATASTAPLKFTTGTSLTTAEAGAMEYTTDDLFFTISTGTARKRFLFADATGGLTSGRIPIATTNGRLTDAATLLSDGTNLGIGGSPGSSYNLSVTGSTATLAGVRILSTIAPGVAGDAYGFYTNPGMVEQGSGTHGMFASMRVAGPSVTAGAATLTRTAAIYLSDNSNGSVTDNNYAIYSVLAGPTYLNGNLELGTVGNKISIAAGGANASVGTATLVSGTVTVNTNIVTANSIIFITVNTPSGTLGPTYTVPVGSITPGTSFVINAVGTTGSVTTTDNSTINYWIIN